MANLSSMTNGWLRSSLIIRFFPFVFLFLEVSFGFLSGLTSQPNVALVMFMSLWMVLWWVFEIMPLGITALIPMVFLPLMRITSIDVVASKYSHHVIYLFLGGFIVARALEKTKLSERIALEILKLTGKSDKGIVAGFGIATAFLSMWISNTATTVMMIPIAYSVLCFLKDHLDEQEKVHVPMLSIVLYLTIAYSANIGGIMTPVGTPPNVVFVGFLEELYGQKIDFWKWMLAVSPPSIVVLFLQFKLLNKLFPHSLVLPEGFSNFISKKLKDMGPMSPPQKVSLGVFLMVAFLWVFKDFIHKIVGAEFINDSSVAILGGALLFLIPAQSEDGRLRAPLDVDDISKLPWNIVLLFGGGMAMAAALKDVGLIEMATGYFASLNIQSPWLLVLALSGMALFLTEIMSNVALSVVALPVVMNLGVGAGLGPLMIGLPVAICTSFAFMMPISTPPNAIVFGTGQVRMKDMMKAGAFLNVISLAVVMTLGWWLFKLVLL